MKTGIELIAQERKEQIEKHGRTIDLDVHQNTNYQLSEAASVLCRNHVTHIQTYPEDYIPEDWMMSIWKKMVGKPYIERLIIAGALIAAEIDRLQNGVPEKE